MAIKGTRATQIANDTNVTPVTFNFKTYDGTYQTFYNNAEQIDFVTWNGNLYVTVVDGTEYVAGDPAEHGFLLVVAKGEDGEMGATGEQGPAGHAPRITAKFEGNQVTIYADGVRIAATNDLTPPSWRPELVNHTIVWSKTKDDTTPSPIDLDLLRPTDANPVIFRVDSDNTRRSDEESGPAKFIQWKYEGEEYWRNLISIDELMNVALAGISFWVDAEDSNSWHFGHREVISATYDVQEEGGKSIAHVELGDVLFDAGRIPFANYELEFGELENRILALEQALADPNVDLTPYYDVFATKDWTSLNFTSKEEFTAWKERVNQDYAKKTDLPNTNTFLTRDAAQSLYQPIGNYLTTTDGEQLARKSEIPDVSRFITLDDIPTYDYIENLGFQLENDELQYRIQKNNQWGEWRTIPTSSILGDNCIVSVDFSQNDKELIFTWEDNTSQHVSLASLVGNNGVTEQRVGELISAALANFNPGSNVSVNQRLNSGTPIADITVGSSTTTLYAPNNSGNGGGIQTVTLDLQLGGANNRTLQYKLSTDGSGSWQNGPELPAGGNADLSNIKLRIRTDNSTSKKYLELSRDGGTTWVDPLELPAGGTTPDPTGEIDLSNYVLVSYLEDNYFNKTQSDNRYLLRSELTGGLVSYRTFTIYQRTNSNTTAPNTPDTSVAATWDVTNGVLTLPSGYTQWKNHPDNATSATPYLWTTSATFKSTDGSRTTPWETPICLTGEEGEDGVDGKFREFVYILTNGTKPTLDESSGIYPIGENSNHEPLYTNAYSKNYIDFLPGTSGMIPVPTGPNGSTIDGMGWTGWRDNPQGVTDSLITEWVSFRTISYDNGNDNPTFSNFSDPVIWSMWGEDGMDGDGVEYIFYVGGSNAVTVDPQTGKATLNVSEWGTKIPTRQDQLEGANGFNNQYHYQIDDWCPDGTTRGGYQMPDYNWTDNPSDVDFQQPYEFVCIRKYNGTTKQWGPFSEPKLWGYYGTTTIETTVYGSTNNKPYTCYAFCRTNNNIAGYTVDYDFSAFGNAQTTYSDLTQAQKDLYYTNPQNYVKTMNGNSVVNNIVWSDTIPQGTEQLWLIQNHIGDETQVSDTGWTSPQKWGDQAGFQVEYAVSDSSTTDRVYARTVSLPNLGTLNNGTPKYETEDPLRDPDGDGIDEATWRQDVLTAGMGIWGDENDVIDPDYMATCFKKSNGVWTDWQIARIKGENGRDGNDGLPGTPGADGSEIEFIYYRTKTNNCPTINTNNYFKGTAQTNGYRQVADALPQVGNVNSNDLDAGVHSSSEGGNYWHDNPSGVDSTWKYEWTSSRRSYYSNGVKMWEDFYIPATVWSKYGENGQDGDGIEYIYYRCTSETFADNFWNGQGTKPANKVIDPSTILKTVNGFQDKNTEYIPDGWSDDPQGVTEQIPYEWVSVRRYNGGANNGQGEWQEFSQPVIWAKYGKDGQDGAPGTSVSIKGTLQYATDLRQLTTTNLTVGDCYIIIQGVLNPNTSAWGTIYSEAYTSSHIWSYGGPDNNLNDDTNQHICGFDDLGEFANVTPNNIYMRFARVATTSEQNNPVSGTTANCSVIIGGVAQSKWITMLPTNSTGPFMGLYTGETESNNVTDYKWSKWDGDDYYGLESIFLKLREGLTPVRPTKALLSSSLGSNATRITGFRTHNSNGELYSISSRSEVDYEKFDYLPVVESHVSGETTNTQQWEDKPQDVYDNTPTKYICYQSTRNIKLGIIEWSEPITYIPYVEDGENGTNGTDGMDGVDGTYEEYVYARNDSTTTPPLMSYKYAWANNAVLSATVIGGNSLNIFNAYDALPFIFDDSSNAPINSSNHSNFSTWTDHPEGVGSGTNEKVEWVSRRKIAYLDRNNPHTPTFGPFTEPVIWSSFGSNGRDGDGLEYVFWGVSIAQSEIIEAMIQNANNHEIFPDQNSSFTGTVNNKHYQDSDFLPTLTITGNTVLQSVDNNPGITSAHPCIYASKRKFHDSGSGGSWGNFGPVTLWNVQGPQGPQGPAGTNGANGNVYTVVPTFTSLVASNPTTNNGTTTYSITGSAGWHLYENGVAQSNAYCEAYLGSTQLTVSHSNGSNDFSVTIPNNTSSSTLFVQILWYNSSSKTNFYDGAIIPVSIKGADGQNGQDASSQSIEGPVMRLRQWTNNTAYYNGTLAASDGITYLDVIWVNEGTPQIPEINYYKCVNDHTSASSGNFSAGNNWELYTMMSDTVFDTILARSAYIANLTAKQVVITDNNIVVAGMASGTAINAASGVGTNGTVSETVNGTVESVRIWAGTPATSGNLLTTPFRVMDNGHLYATNATISGNVTANKITTTGAGTIEIVFGNSSVLDNPDPNTLYFIY